MKIAISAIIFDNDRHIAAQRPRALAEHLASQGHEVTVFTAASDTVARSPIEGVETIYLPAYAVRSNLRASDLPLKQRVALQLAVLPTSLQALILSNPLLAKIFGVKEQRRKATFSSLNKKRLQTVHRLRAILDSRSWKRESRGALNNLLRNRRFDAVFSTYGPFGSLELGKVIATHNPNAVNVVDIRDSIVKPGMLWAVTKYLEFKERQILKQASLITVVSEGLKLELLRQKSGRARSGDIHVLYNGFNRRDGESLRVPSLNTGPLKIGYTGQIYGDLQDPTPLFSALSSLSRDYNFEVHYAGKQSHLLRDAAINFGVAGCLIDHGFLTHDQSLALQGSMDVLLVLSWNTHDSQGIISGKFGEYLGRQKPIIAIVSGDKESSELARLVRKLDVGCAFESTSPESSFHELRCFLKESAKKRQAGEHLVFSPDQVEIRQFDYGVTASRLVDLIVEHG